MDAKLIFPYEKTELLKWVALALMLGDHINKYLFNGYYEFLFNAGRICLPVFVFVLAANLSKASRPAYVRTIKRLFIFGVISSVPYYYLGTDLPLNVLFTLLIIVCVVFLIELKSYYAYASAAFVFTAGSAFVEFGWSATALGVTLFYLFKTGSKLLAILALIALSSLYFTNGNHYALLALPLIAFTPCFKVIPRFRWAFYAFYPVHLAALLVIRIPMAAAGYLFF